MNKTKNLKKYRVTKKTRKSNKKYFGGNSNKSIDNETDNETDNEKDTEKDTKKDTETVNEKDNEKATEKDNEKDTKKDTETVNEKATEKDNEKANEKANKKDNEKDTEESVSESESESSDSETDSNKGVIDIIEDKVGEFAADTGEFVANKTLRLFGLETIKNAKKEADEHSDDNNSNVNNQNSMLSKIGNVASNVLSSTTSVVKGIGSDIQSITKGIGSDIQDVANQTTADAIGNVNEVLGSPQLNQTVQQAAKNTTVLSENLLENFNDAINSREMKQQTAEALNNIGDYTEIAVEAFDLPLDKAIDELNEAGTKAASGAISGVIKVSTDAVAAVPYLGAVVELGKIVNDGSKAIGSVIEAGSESIETLSNLYTDTAKGIDKGIKELEKKKREAEEIRERTHQSIQKFTKPINNISSIPGKSKVPTGGSKKTKKRLLGRKGKSKRVRFAE